MTIQMWNGTAINDKNGIEDKFNYWGYFYTAVALWHKAELNTSDVVSLTL